MAAFEIQGAVARPAEAETRSSTASLPAAIRSPDDSGGDGLSYASEAEQRVGREWFRPFPVEPPEAALVLQHALLHDRQRRCLGPS